MKSKNLFQSVKDVLNGKIALSIFTFSTTFIAGFAAATVALGLKGGYHNSSIAEAIICGLILLFYGIYGTYKLYKLNKVKVKLTTNKFREIVEYFNWKGKFEHYCVFWFFICWLCSWGYRLLE